MFPKEVKKELRILISELAYYGSLEYPNGRKLRGYDLFEIRVKLEGAYRCLYTYWGNEIILLSAFQKKTQKTPIREIEKVIKRRNNLN